MSHDNRIRGIQTAFVQANDQLIALLQGLDDRTATMNPTGGWNAAQIGWHVALTSEFLAGAMSGAIAEMSVPKPDGFEETFAKMEFPARVQTFPALEPPADTTKAAAVTKLRASTVTFATALAATTADRCAGNCVKLPFAVLSIYEVGEFAGGHIHRHIGQVNRTIATV